MAAPRPKASAPAVVHGAITPTRKGFTSKRAERWVLASALITGLVYVVRHLVEGETSPPPASSAARQFLGAGSPPTVGQWTIAYGTAYLGLSLLAVVAPEIAASLAGLAVVGTFLEAGGQLATDLQALEQGAGSGPTASQLSKKNAASAIAQTGKLITAAPGTVYVIGPGGTKTPAGQKPAPVWPALRGAPITTPITG